MALFGFFRRKGYASSWMQLTVVSATALQGLEPDQAFILRGKIMAARPIDFTYANSDSFMAFFPGTPEGLLAGTRLMDVLREVGRDKYIPSFGVAVQQGECLAQMSGTGRFSSKPMGGLVSRTKELAITAAKAQ